MITDIGNETRMTLHQLEAANPPREIFEKDFAELLNTFRNVKYYNISFKDKIIPAGIGNSGIHHTYSVKMKSPTSEIGIYRYDGLKFYYAFYVKDSIEWSDMINDTLANEFISVIEDNTRLSIQALSYDKLGYV
jgi:hypothetical protein